MTKCGAAQATFTGIQSPAFGAPHTLSCSPSTPEPFPVEILKERPVTWQPLMRLPQAKETLLLRPEFIVYAPHFREDIGGFIALHLLCHRLNQLGFRAALWPWSKPAAFELNNWKSVRSHLGWRLKRREAKFPKGPFGGNPTARHGDLADAVVIYPETTSGNPLGAKKVARWFLHKPGYHTGEINYGVNEIYFFMNEAFNDPAINSREDHLLCVTFLNPKYERTNFGSRTGSCVLVYKGKDRKLDQHPADAIPIDRLTHEEKSKVFNQVQLMYCYDLYTFYATYALMCGCVPVIIPLDGLSKEQWMPSEQHRQGYAYGAWEIDLARTQREAFLTRLDKAREEEDQTVRRFVEKCRLYFGH
jgi:hypothetical protein